MCRSSLRLLQWKALFLLLFLLCSPGALYAGEEPVRFGFSVNLFRGGINENDARAAVRVWVDILNKTGNLAVDGDTRIFRSTEEMSQTIEDGIVDGIGCTTEEFFDLSQRVSTGRFVSELTYGGKLTEQMVLLVRRNSPIQGFADLENASLNIYDNTRMSLARVWTELELHALGLPRLDGLTKMVSWERKLTQVVLPVFFGKVDAALLTRSGLETMIELNPQLAESLVVVAESEPVVPSIVFFRGDFRPGELDELFSAMVELDKQPAGKQVLTVFQSGAVREGEYGEILPTLEMIGKCRQIP